MLPACAVWALLPLIASRQLGLGADGYGLLFAALGVGAVVGRAGAGPGQAAPVVQRGARLSAAAGSRSPSASLVLAPSLLVALPLLVVCGFGWTATVSTVISELQLFLPGWVRARAIAIYLMVFLGSQAVAAPIWGLVTQRLGALRGRPARRGARSGVSALAGWC